MNKFNLKSAYSEVDHITDRVEEWSDKLDVVVANDFFREGSDFNEKAIKAQQALEMAWEDLQELAVDMEMRIESIEEENRIAGLTKEGSTMKLRYTKGQQHEVEIGDRVVLSDGTRVTIEHFAPPHKASSSGKVTVKEEDYDGPYAGTREYFVGVIGAEWVGREEPGGDRYEENPPLNTEGDPASTDTMCATHHRYSCGVCC